MPIPSPSRWCAGRNGYELIWAVLETSLFESLSVVGGLEWVTNSSKRQPLGGSPLRVTARDHLAVHDPLPGAAGRPVEALLPRRGLTTLPFCLRPSLTLCAPTIRRLRGKPRDLGLHATSAAADGNQKCRPGLLLTVDKVLNKKGAGFRLPADGDAPRRHAPPERITSNGQPPWDVRLPQFAAEGQDRAGVGCGAHFGTVRVEPRRPMTGRHFRKGQGLARPLRRALTRW